MPDQAQTNLIAAKSFVTAVERMDGSIMDAFFSPDVKQIEWPNLFKPKGEERDLDKLKADIEKARGILREQSYEITRELADGDCVVLEMIWRGTMEIDFPPLTKDQTLQAHCVAIFDFENGQVTGLRNYDCFDPFVSE
jgi:limonene-1,2-epoxide hydrolase